MMSSDQSPMTKDEIVRFASTQREEGYIDGLISARAFMRGWVSNSPNLTREQRHHINKGLDEIMNSCVKQGKRGNDDTL